jgi:hypothetical protein
MVFALRFRIYPGTRNAAIEISPITRLELTQELETLITLLLEIPERSITCISGTEVLVSRSLQAVAKSVYVSMSA